MKYKHIPVKIYDWDIHFFDMGRIKDKDPILKKMVNLIGHKNTNKVKKIAYGNSINGGDHYFNHRFKTSVIIVYKTSSRKKKMAIIIHELQHSVDRICENTRINDIEARAYLLEFIGTPILTKL